MGKGIQMFTDDQAVFIEGDINHNKKILASSKSPIQHLILVYLDGIIFSQEKVQVIKCDAQANGAGIIFFSSRSRRQVEVATRDKFNYSHTPIVIKPDEVNLDNYNIVRIYNGDT